MNSSRRCSNHSGRYKQQQQQRGLASKLGDGGECGEEGEENEEVEAKRKKLPFIYRLNDGTTTSASLLLHEVFQERGWREWCEDKELSFGSSSSHVITEAWNLWWRNGSLKSQVVQQFQASQLTNHIPKATAFCRKDFLARYLKRMHRTYGPIYDFSPISFNLPLEYTRLCAEHTRRSRQLEHGNSSRLFHDKSASNPELVDTDACWSRPIWICKPVGRSQGRGIRVFDQVTEIAYDSSSVVQEYITRPFLIAGYKWDLRIYVAIVSVRPLRIYAYREGLARFATNKYDLGKLSDPFAHLTNVSVNKKNPAYRVNKEQIGQGSKWSLGRLRKHLQDNGVSDWFLWQRIMSILVLTIVGEAHTLSHLDAAGNCFEFLGFDILVNENLEATLLEVNTNPSLANDCVVDEIVKRPMLHDLLSLLGLPDQRKMTDEDGQNGGKESEVLTSWKDCKNSAVKSRNIGGSGHSNRQRRLLRQSSLGSVYLTSHEEGPGDDPEVSTDAAPGEGNNWARIFPFDAWTNQRSSTMTIHDVKIAIVRMQSYMKVAQRVASAEGIKNDVQRDHLAGLYGKLDCAPWHPP